MWSNLSENQFMSKTIIQSLALAALTLNLPATEFHVAISGKDSNMGTATAPFLTIQHAADVAQPGDVITVHAGTYRERINPPRGGESDAKRITYQAAPGEKVEIKGSEIVKDWVKVQDDVWKATLPNSFFGHFNPFTNLIRGDWFNGKGRQHHTAAVYLDGEWLIEATKQMEVLMRAGASPAWMGQGGQQYLLNVAWLRPVGGANAPRTPASGFVSKQGTKNAPCTEGGDCIGFIEHGNWVRYERVDFGQNTEQLEIRAASETEGGIIEIHRDAPEGELLGACTVPNTGGWQMWASFKPKIKPLSGVKTICLVFKGLKSPALNAQLWFAEVDASNTTIMAQFKGVNPNEHLIEVNARRTVFYPDQPGRNFITVRGFTMRHAATPWAPPTAEQVGLIGTHWSKGWIIENNTISHSVCSGIALGKHGDKYDNTSADTAEGYVKTIERAHAHPIAWSKENIGGHVVRNNYISHCEQTGIVGSMGCSFSTVTGNDIHDIHVRRLFTGAEMAGIKFHGAIDCVISGNHIYRCGDASALWLDWMAQGAQVTGNLFHDNFGGLGDMFLEMQHGPILVANNLLLSKRTSFALNAQGIAAAHNLITGPINNMRSDTRSTPYQAAHSTKIAGMCVDSAQNDSGDHRLYNNIFVAPCNLHALDKSALACFAAGNVFTKGSQASKFDTEVLLKPDFDAGAKVTEKPDGWYLELAFDKTWGTEQKRQLVTTELLGKAKIPDLPFENTDGSPLKIATDYFGKARSQANPFPGPFELPLGGKKTLKVWPLAAH